ncbi:MAG: protein phosphatase 2C domain-containing protein [Gammaproteobacteria bacterium]|nr:protein phosphatase 2C domain-containing protein [Gammaproteobacteria bacterium]MCP5199090.1 protein phosphatase 2C domain-containing protein [Gammaproteobacteria bacterium]
MTPPCSFTGVSLDTPATIAACGFDVAMLTRACPGREQANQDGVLLLAYGDDTLIAAVADGAGGYPDGDAASGAALAALHDACLADTSLAPRAAILNGFEAAHAAIKTRGAGGATTLVAVELNGTTLRTYHAGDSGVLVVGQRGRVKLQSVFHSPTGYLVEAGLLDEAEALHHEHRHMVSNLLGMEPMSVEIGSPLELAARDTVVIASDGLYDNLYVDEIVETARKGPLGACCSALAATAARRMHGEADSDAPSKPDDLSVIVLRRARP